MMMKRVIIFLLQLFILYKPMVVQSLTSLTTSSTIQAASVQEVFHFLATPTHWPSIVASSHSVQKSSIKHKMNHNNDIDRPFQVGDHVDEIFGLPPLLPLRVTWECIVSEMELESASASASIGRLEFVSPEGVPPLATNCRMKFQISSSSISSSSQSSVKSNVNVDANVDANVNVKVDLTMEYEALNPIVMFAATPLLNVDNSLALKVLLPLAMKMNMK